MYKAIACVKAYVHMQEKAGHYTIAQLNGLTPTMLVSCVKAVVACNVTAEGLHFSAFHFVTGNTCQN